MLSSPNSPQFLQAYCDAKEGIFECYNFSCSSDKNKQLVLYIENRDFKEVVEKIPALQTAGFKFDNCPYIKEMKDEI